MAYNPITGVYTPDNPALVPFDIVPPLTRNERVAAQLKANRERTAASTGRGPVGFQQVAQAASPGMPAPVVAPTPTTMPTPGSAPGISPSAAAPSVVPLPPEINVPTRPTPQMARPVPTMTPSAAPNSSPNSQRQADALTSFGGALAQGIAQQGEMYGVPGAGSIAGPLSGLFGALGKLKGTNSAGPGAPSGGGGFGDIIKAIMGMVGGGETATPGQGPLSPDQLAAMGAAGPRDSASAFPWAGPAATAAPSGMSGAPRGTVTPTAGGFNWSNFLTDMGRGLAGAGTVAPGTGGRVGPSFMDSLVGAFNYRGAAEQQRAQTGYDRGVEDRKLKVLEGNAAKPLSDIGRVEDDFRSGKISQSERDDRVAGLNRKADTATAEMKNYDFAMKRLGMSSQDAAAWARNTKNKSPAAVRQEIYLKALGQPGASSEDARTVAEDGMKYLFPDQQPPTPAPAPAAGPALPGGGPGVSVPFGPGPSSANPQGGAKTTTYGGQQYWQDGQGRWHTGAPAQ